MASGRDQPLQKSPAPVILFDGHCLMCSASVRWIHKRDPSMVFKFAAQQSSVGSALLAAAGMSAAPDAGGTVVVLDRATGDAFTRSGAALYIARRLRWPWSWLGTLRIIPRPIRDAAYNLVARNRLRFAGRSEQCFMPDEGLRQRFEID